MKVTVNGQDYILLTQCPLVGTTERYEFKTDVHEVYNGGSEERIPGRDYARQSMSYSVHAYRAETVGLFNDLYSWLRKTYLVPQPLESQDVGNLADDFIEADTSLVSIEVGTLILVQPLIGSLEVREVTEIGRYEVIEEEPVYIDGYRLNSAVIANDATIYPLRKCIIDGNPSISVSESMIKSLLNLRVIDNFKYEIAEAPTQYNGDDLYFTPLLLDGEVVDIELMQQQNIVDGQIGQFWQFTNWLNPKIGKNLRVLMHSKQEYMDYKKWFYRRRGMLNAFWLPSYEQNFNVVSSDSNSITVKDENYLANRVNIAIKSDGVWTAHAITNAATSGANKVLTLSPSPPTTIQRVSYLGLYRLGSDSVQFIFRGNDIIEATVPILELSP